MKGTTRRLSTILIAQVIFLSVYTLASNTKTQNSNTIGVSVMGFFNNENLTTFTPEPIDYSRIIDYRKFYLNIQSEQQKNKTTVLEYNAFGSILTSCLSKESDDAQITLNNIMIIMERFIKTNRKDDTADLTFLNLNKCSTNAQQISNVFLILGLESIKYVKDGKNYLGSVIGVFQFDKEGSCEGIEIRAPLNIHEKSDVLSRI